MALDPNIALGYKGIELPDPLAQYGQIAQLQNARQTNQLNALKMQEAQATMEERNALRKLNPSSPDYEEQLFRLNPQLGLNYRKEASAAAASKAQQLSHEATAAKTKQEMSNQSLRDISNRPSDANITAHMEDILASPLYSETEKTAIQATAKSLLAMPFEQRQSVLSQQGASAADMRPVSVAPGASLVGRDNKVMFTAPERQDTDLIRNFNAARAQGFGGTLFDYEKKIKEAGRTPAQPSAPVAVVDPVTGKQVYVSREKAMGMTPAAAMESLPPKEIQKREAALPQATSALKGFESKSDSFAADLQKLRDHPGLAQITGIAAGRLPAVTPAGRAAQALYDKVVAKGGFQALQDMRDASKTGGALGNVSNQEGKQLTASFAAINRVQDAADVRAAIDEAIANIGGAKTRMREAYDSTYSYKTGNAPASGGVIEFGSLK